MIVSVGRAGLLGPAGRGRSWTALSIEWPLPKVVNLTTAILLFKSVSARSLMWSALPQYLFIYTRILADPGPQMISALLLPVRLN